MNDFIWHQGLLFLITGALVELPPQSDSIFLAVNMQKCCMLLQNRFEYQNTVEVKLLQIVEECLTKWKYHLKFLVVTLADTLFFKF